jgi:hypothetical protein
MSEIFGEQTLSTFARCIDEWIASIAAQNTAILTFQRDEGPDRRWYVRMRGEEKEFTTIWLWLGQRTLKYETYVMPAPAENAEALYEHVLRRNDKLVGAHFSIGIEDAIFLRGDMPLSVLSEEELDRAIGTLYATVELVFPTIIRMGFASHFTDNP